MPYIKKEDRTKFQAALELLSQTPPTTPGELNYLISMISSSYARAKGEMKYATGVNDIIGALECAKLEWYRRIAIPYEDKCIKKNGDIS